MIGYVLCSDYYVSKTGSDNNNGTSILWPFLTIEKGVGMIRSGDYLFLAPGVWSLRNTTTLYGLQNVLISGSSEAGYPYNRTIIQSSVAVLSTAENRIRPIFLIRECRNVTISNLDIMNSFSTRYNHDANEPIKDVSQGSALKINHCRDIAITNVLFKNNIAHWGGATYVLESINVVFQGCLFEENRAITINNYFETVIENIEVHHMISGKFYANSPVAQKSIVAALGFASKPYIENGRGGAVYIINSANITIDGCFFKKNSAGTGGAIYLEHIREISIFDSFFEGNTVEDEASVIYFKNISNVNAKDFVTDSVFYDNHCRGKLQCKIIYFEAEIAWNEGNALWASIPLVVFMSLPFIMVLITILWGCIYAIQFCSSHCGESRSDSENLEMQSALVSEDSTSLVALKRKVITRFEQLDHFHHQIFVWFANSLGFPLYNFDSLRDKILFYIHKFFLILTLFSCIGLVIFRAALGIMILYSYDDWTRLFNFFDVTVTGTEITMFFGFVLYVSMLWNSTSFKQHLDVFFEIERKRKASWKRIITYYVVIFLFIVFPFVYCISSPFLPLIFGAVQSGLFKFPGDTSWINAMSFLENFLSYSLSSITLLMFFFLCEKYKFVVSQKFHEMDKLVLNETIESPDLNSALKYYYEIIDDLNTNPIDYINVIYFIWWIALFVRVIAVQIFFLRTDITLILGDVIWWGTVLILQLFFQSLVSWDFDSKLKDHVERFRRRVLLVPLDKFHAYLILIEKDRFRFRFLGREITLTFLIVMITILVPIIKVITELSSTILQIVYRA